MTGSDIWTRPRLSNDADVINDGISRQASDNIENVPTPQREAPRPVDEPTDHEAEGAMLYVMARGRL